MEEKDGFDASGIIERTGGRNRKLRAYVPPPDNPPEVEPVAGETENPTEAESVREKEPSRRKRNQVQGYKETFLKRNEIKTRQCVYISYDVHAVIAKLVRALADAGSDISVGGYIDTVLNEHLQVHKDEINELYRQREKDLL